LAIVWAIVQLRPYLEGKRFVVRTDHHSIRWVLNLSDAQGRLARWRLRLLEFDFEVQYTPGRAHHGADTMSRLRPGEHSPCVADEPVEAEIPCFALAPVPDPHLLPAENLRALQETDPTAKISFTSLGAPDLSTTIRWALWGTYSPRENSRSSSPGSWPHLPR
jgi:hypothetical protein